MKIPKLSGEGIPGERDALVFILACCKVPNAEALADKLLREHPTLDTALEYVDTLGLGDIVNATVACVEELGTSRELHFSRRGRKLSNTEEAGTLLMSWFHGCDIEQFVLLCLNEKYRLVDCKVISTGTATSVRFDPKDALNGITEPNTKYIILAHNHPASTSLPSRQDVKTTSLVARLLRVAGYMLLDHIIVYDNDFVSMRESSLLEDKEDFPIEFVVRGDRLDYRKITKTKPK